MGWKFEFNGCAARQFARLDRPIQLRDVTFFDKNLGHGEPRASGHGLVGDRAGEWTYRIGDDRAVREIQARSCVVIVLDVEHRSKACRKRH